jgi:Holliday junction resolvasome RuvABC endonuclease subunit
MVMTLLNNEIMSTIVGLDLSLTGTGMVVLDNGSIMTKKLIKTKPTAKNPLKEVERLLTIKAEITSELERVKPDLVLVEGLAFGARNATATMQLAGLNYLIREYLAVKKLPFVVVAPTTLKKFILGKGVGPKDVMLLETFKRYGISFMDNNLCLAAGTMVLTENGEIPIEEIEVGAKVLTRSGYRAVTNSGLTGIKSTIEKIGIVGTPDHPVITLDGVKTLEDINKNDILYIWNARLSCIEEENITDAIKKDILPIHLKNLEPRLNSDPHAVYNLTVEGASEFFANRILVHNCDAFALAQCGVALLGESRQALTKPQKEVTELLSVQIKEPV